MKPLGAVIAGLFICALTAACGEEPTVAPPRPTATPTIEAVVTAGARTVTDMAGRRIRVPDESDRVVVLSPSALDFAVALGLEIIGEPTDVGSAATGANPVGTTLNPDFPAIAALDPDLVIADAAYHGSRTRDFDSFPYPVFILSATDHESIRDAFNALGQATGKTDEAKSSLDKLDTAVARILDEAQDHIGGPEPPPRVLILTGGGRDIFGGGTTTYVGSLVTALEGENVLGEVPEGGPIPGFGVIGVGESAATLPDVVLIISSGEGGLADQIAADPSWPKVPALVDNRIHELDRELFLRAPGPRMPEALETLLPLLFPD